MNQFQIRITPQLFRSGFAIKKEISKASLVDGKDCPKAIGELREFVTV
jgi:hypothetical protein